MNLGHPERAEALAGEYVLGTLRGAARARFARLARTERSLAEAVRRWEERLLPFADQVAPVLPPARVWPSIRARIHGPGAPPQRASPSGGSGWWRAVALASLTLVVVLAVALLRPPSEAAAFVVVLAGEDGKPALVASTEGASAYLTVTAVAPVAQAADRALELWMLPAQGNPRSLGLVTDLAARGIARVALPGRPDQALRDIPALAISLEPKGGSVTGLPTGPVLYKGSVQRLD